MEEFFPKERGAKGMKKSSDKNISDIQTCVQPWLKRAGFDCVKDKQDNTSNRQKLFLIADPTRFIIAQIIVVESLATMCSRANTNISKEIVDSTTEENRREVHLDVLRKDNVYLMLYVKQGGGYFMLKPYADIPATHYNLTYRGRPDRKNRMWLPTEHIPTLQRISKLGETLKTIFND
jgi:hypothetical protein